MLNWREPSIGWPPPDPDRFPRTWKCPLPDSSITLLSDDEYVRQFRERQQRDFRHRVGYNDSQSSSHDYDLAEDRDRSLIPEDDLQAPAAWKDSDGDRLEDFGVDEDIEFYDEDEAPLVNVLQRQQSTHLSSF